jgi:hypothetical protein
MKKEQIDVVGSELSQAVLEACARRGRVKPDRAVQHRA